MKTYVLLFLCCTVTSLYGQNKPKAKEIAQAAGSTRLVETASVSASQGGRTATFTPIDFSTIHTADDLQNKVVGRLKTDVPAKAIGLRPGSYIMYLQKQAGVWHAYFSDGKNVIQAAQFEFSHEEKTPGVNKPSIIATPKWHVCLYDEWGCLYPN